MGLLIPILKRTGLNSSLMISHCVSFFFSLPLSCSLSLSHCTHKREKKKTLKSDLPARRSAHKEVKTRHTEPLVTVKSWNKSKEQRQETIRVVTKAVVAEHPPVWVQCGAQPPATEKPPPKFGWGARAGAGGDGGDGVFEGRERGAEWSRRGRNSAVGCISVSRSDGWALALFVLCCHTALAPARALMRGGRTAGQEHAGPPMPVICHAAVLLRRGDTWRQRGKETQQGRLRVGWGSGPHTGPRTGPHTGRQATCTRLILSEEVSQSLTKPLYYTKHIEMWAN